MSRRTGWVIEALGGCELSGSWAKGNWLQLKGGRGERLSCWQFKVSEGTTGNKIFRDPQWQTRWSNGLQSQRGEKQRGCCPSFLEKDCDDGIAAVHVEVRSEPRSHHPESDTDRWHFAFPSFWSGHAVSYRPSGLRHWVFCRSLLSAGITRMLPHSSLSLEPSEVREVLQACAVAVGVPCSSHQPRVSVGSHATCVRSPLNVVGVTGER